MPLTDRERRYIALLEAQMDVAKQALRTIKATGDDHGPQDYRDFAEASLEELERLEKQASRWKAKVAG